MKLKDLITKLQGKPNQDEEVEFLIYQKHDTDIVCIDMAGDVTTDIMRVMGKHMRKNVK